MSDTTKQEDVLELPREERRRDYEYTLVLSANATQEAKDAVIERLRHAIADSQGELIEAGTPKTLPLSYPIRKERQGTFVTVAFRGPVHLPKTITEAIRHEQALLRQFVAERPKVRARKERITPLFTERPPQEDAGERNKLMDEQIDTALKSTE